MNRKRLLRLLWLGIAVLYGISIPWYREPDSAVEIWLGLPDWVAVALGCYVAAAFLNAWAWWLRPGSDPGESES